MSAHGKVQDTSPNHTLTYRPDIDGLRAVSILIVVLFHAGFGFKGGYVGVDVFFVISGYLITAMLLREMKRGHICLVDFWERRIRRIFPALFVTVASTLAAGCLLMLPESLLELAKSSIAQSLMGANMHFWATSGYLPQPQRRIPCFICGHWPWRSSFISCYRSSSCSLPRSAPRSTGSGAPPSSPFSVFFS